MNSDLQIGARVDALGINIANRYLTMLTIIIQLQGPSAYYFLLLPTVNIKCHIIGLCLITRYSMTANATPRPWFFPQR